MKVALVTGAGSGIGRATSLALLAAGYSVVLAGRRAEALQQTVAQAGEHAANALAVPDRRRRSGRGGGAVRRASRTRFGRLDLLFNNAGTGAPAVPMDELTFEQWKAVVDVNLTGVFLCTQARVQADEEPDAARRPHHQQRLDLGARAAAVQRALHRDQARRSPA